MKTNTINNTEDFLKLIKDNCKQLPHGKAQTDLMSFIDSFEVLEKNSDEYERIIKLSREMSEHLEKFNDEDFSSLISFFVLAQINDYDTFLAYENVRAKITDLKKKALYLKLLDTIGYNFITIALIDGKEVEYDVCHDAKHSYYAKKVKEGKLVYLGCGLCYKIGGVKQNFKEKEHFWKWTEGNAP